MPVIKLLSLGSKPPSVLCFVTLDLGLWRPHIFFFSWFLEGVEGETTRQEEEERRCFFLSVFHSCEHHPIKASSSWEQEFLPMDAADGLQVFRESQNQPQHILPPQSITPASWATQVWVAALQELSSEFLSFCNSNVFTVLSILWTAAFSSCYFLDD